MQHMQLIRPHLDISSTVTCSESCQLIQQSRIRLRLPATAVDGQNCAAGFQVWQGEQQLTIKPGVHVTKRQSQLREMTMAIDDIVRCVFELSGCAVPCQVSDLADRHGYPPCRSSIYNMCCVGCPNHNHSAVQHQPVQPTDTLLPSGILTQLPKQPVAGCHIC